MHDLFEGVCNFDLSRLLIYYILDVKLFTLETLNCRIQTLNVGENEKRNRPPIITIGYLKKKKINMYASQMMFFVRFLGVAVGELVPLGDKVWNLYLNLRHIVDLVTAPSFQKHCEILLDVLIQEHHEMYLQLFGEPLKPKHHHMCPVADY